VALVERMGLDLVDRGGEPSAVDEVDKPVGVEIRHPGSLDDALLVQQPAGPPGGAEAKFDESVRDAKLPERQPEKWPRDRSVERVPSPGSSGPSAPRRACPGRSGTCSTPGAARDAPLTGSCSSSPTGWTPSRAPWARSCRCTPNLLAETRVRSELRHDGLKARLASKPVDRIRQPLDPIIVAGPWLLAGWGTYKVGKRVAMLVR
jgi:hypothetical protein